MNTAPPFTDIAAVASPVAALGEILLRTEAVAFRWIAAPGWPVALVSENVRRWGFDPRALERGDPPFAELIHPEDLPRVTLEVERHNTLGRDRFLQEYRLRNGSNGWRWVEDHTWIERGNDGVAVAFNGLLLDVTGRKQAELALELATTAVPALLEDEPLDDLVRRVLEGLGLGMGADRVYIFETHERDGEVLASQRYEWCQEGVGAQIDNPELQNLPFERLFPRWLQQLRADRAISGIVATFPQVEREILEAQEIQSLIVVPVSLRGRLWGFVGFDAVRHRRQWSQAEERVLRLTAAALGAAIEQMRVLDALRQSEQRDRLALEGAGAGSWEWRPQTGWRWSERCAQLLRMDPTADSSAQQRWLDAIHPVDRAWVDAEFEHAWRTGAPLSIEYRVLCGEDGRWLKSLGRQRLGADGKPDGMVGILLDVDRRKRDEERLRLAAAVIDSTRDGVVVTDLDARITAVNRAYCDISGYTEEELLGQNPRLLQSGRHDQRFYATMWAELVASGHWQGEIWSRRRNGEVFPQWLAISAVPDENGRTRHYVGIVTDITRLKQTESELALLAHYDPLTGLPNRLLAQSRLRHSIERAEHDGRRLALLFVDMDRFKTVNDSLGHHVGDELLCAVGERFRRAVGPADTVARLGGDEFLIIVENVGSARDAGEAARGLLLALSEPFLLPSGHEVYADASVGISLFPEDGANATELVRSADAALYRAKDLGRNTFHFYTPSLVESASDRLELEGRLRRALARNEFEVHYQPLLSCEDERIVGVEALVRWQPPGEPLVYPGRFIGLAEETGLIGPLGDWVLETACRQVQRWRRASHPDLRLCVNLSARQLRQPEFADRLTRVLADSGIDPDGIELEITESMLMEHGSLVIGTLHELRALGVRVAIDDFGTGYSSLAYLKRLPLDTLKIDRSFIADIPGHEGGAEIASAIIALGRSLHLDILAEGVENPAQLDFLRARGCDNYQGYLVSPALPAEELAHRFLTLGSPASRYNPRQPPA
ncbi:MAG: EAL domain-containing protein [Xanthomonadales bacterium]|nr:EAL domain-containing protein [Xanthomonadales bacterium]MCE7931022.1 EAL domain-containing protein [Xanthomonadales bacterium PRO6]